MRLTSSTKLIKTQKVPQIHIDELISLFSKYEYCIDFNTKDKQDEQSKNKKSKSVDQIKKENLLLLSEHLIKLKDTFLNQGESRLIKTKELYDLLKTKLGNDLFFLILTILVKILHGNTSTNTNLLHPSFKILFDIISIDVDTELKILLSSVDYSLLSDLFNHETEPSLLQIINSAEINTNELDIQRLKKNISLLYIFIVLNNYFRKNFYEELLIIERIIAEHFIGLENIDSKKYLLKILPEAILDSNSQIKIKSFIYLYLIENNSILKKSVDKLAFRLENNNSNVLKLSEELMQSKEQEKLKDNQIAVLTRASIEKDNEIINLQDSLTKKSDRLEYEVNLYQKQLEGIRADIISNLYRDLRLEVDSLTALARRLDAINSASLNMSISNIKQIVSDLNS